MIVSLLLVPFLNAAVAAAAAFTQRTPRVFVSTPVSNYPKQSVGDCMSTTSVILTPQMSVDEAMTTLLSCGLSGAPVVASEEDKKLVGIVSSFDFLQQEAFEGALLPVEGSLTNVNKYVDAARKICGQSVEDVMNTNVITVQPNTPMREAAALMTEHKLHRLAVVDNRDSSNQLVGVLTAEHVMKDLLHVFQRLPAAAATDEVESENGVEANLNP